jgi:protocatechuate 3,4-dioxygenase beta subunit
MKSEPHISEHEGEQPRRGLTRRRLLQNAGVLGLTAAVGGSVGAGPGIAAVTSAMAVASASSLTLTPEQEEGPFYVAIEKIRKNITLGRTGVPLHLKIKLEDTSGKPIKGAACDIWQCDALGVYSDESSESTVGQTWLRGVQFTDAHGLAEFITVYPGHYAGRTTHVHVHVHIAGKAAAGTYSGGHIAHTGQLLFDDSITSEVYQLAPYTSDTATRVLNTSDRVYEDQGGSKSMLKLTRLGSTVAAGFVGAVTLIVNPEATPALIGATSSGTSGSTGAPGGAGGTPPSSTGTTTTATTTTTTTTTTAAT